MRIQNDEFMGWVHAGSLPKTMTHSHFNGTDDAVAFATTAAYEVLNKAVKHYSVVTQDKKLSPGERARSLKAGMDFMDDSVQRAKGVARRADEFVQERATAAKEKFIRGTLTDEFALSLAVQLRMLGKDNSTSITTLVMSDPRFIQAINRVPPAVSGLSSEKVKSFTEAAISQHAPDVQALLNTAEASGKTFDRLNRVNTELSLRIARDFDPEAFNQHNEIANLLNPGA